ncbi:hypothetical protein KM043_005676 [Ampulex compressa]|nr:hypothetical protein KM043_005676 [Ampulex compressa]
MLPSTGYFKTINCPFYENGSCERPYCHFKHSRREDVASTGTMATMVESQTARQTGDNKISTIGTSNSEVLQQLVTEAVKKVLADQEVTDTEKFSENIVSQVVQGLTPTLSSNASTSMDTTTSSMIGKHINIPAPITKPVPCVYNPTPIAELKKRHIPIVSYMPTRESRVSVKRKSSPDRNKPWLSIIHEAGNSQSTTVTYKPTAITSTNDQDSVQSYIPSFKSDSSSSNSYEDSNSNDYLLKLKEGYYPKSKKRREEYVPKKVKAPLKTVENLDETVLDQFEPEFDMIDEILTAARTGPCLVPSEDSQDYAFDIEPKFSDDEPSDDIDVSTKMEEETSIKDVETTEERENKNSSEMDDMMESEQASDETIMEFDHRINMDQNNAQMQDKYKQKDSKTKLSAHGVTDSNVAKASDKSINDAKKDTDRSKEEHRSKKRKEKDREKGSHSNSSSSKHKHSHKSSSRDKKNSSTHSKDKDSSHKRHNNKDDSHKSESHSDARKVKEKKDKKDHHTSDRHHKHKSKSSSSRSKTEDHSSEKNRRKQHSHTNHKSDSDAHKNSVKHKINSTDKNSPERCSSPLESVHSFFDEDIFEISDSDHDVQEECLKIFQEYQVSDHPKVVSLKEPAKQEPDIEEVGRKRVAHPSAATAVTRTHSLSQPQKKHINPQQKMYERWRLMREAAAEKAAEKAEIRTQLTATSAPQVQASSNKNKEVHNELSTITPSTETQINGNGRIRIAHVPYARSLALQKQKVADTTAKVLDNKKIDNKTAAQTTKSGARVAHVPQTVPQLIRPEPLQVATQKFPLNVRQYYINLMHDICIQIYTNGEDAAQRALKEELSCHERCKALPVYKNLCILAAHRLRKEVDQNTTTDDSVPSGSGIMSHEAMLAGKSKGSWSVVRTKKSKIDIKGSVLYSLLKKWIMTEQQLRDNGFPRPHPGGQKGHAKIYTPNTRKQNILSKVPNQRFCARCGQAYMVNKQGFAVQQQNCIYHWGRKFTIRGEGKYSCCQQYGSATGCCDAKTHVWEYTDYENLRGYVTTFPKDIAVEEQGVYALDCEMSYTTQGLELTRVTVINEDCNVIYETLVKPENPVVDYNTRFSGITEENMKGVTTTLLDVQATLLTMFSEKTILVGHSLESDFKALKLIHETVVDTSIMFPHKNGPPQKRALKNLCSDYLRKIIQNEVGGHDSKEDAVACMELIQWKVKEEAKLQ